MSQIVGIPCVGGKSKLMPFLKVLMHDIAVEHKLNKYISACGGGGKDVFNQMSCKRIFSRGVIYNEFEKGLYCLITALKDYKNIDKINAGIDELLKTYIRLDDLGNSIEEMFNFALERADADEPVDTEEEILKVATYETVVVFGSVQNNRKRVSKNLHSTENGFYDYFKKHGYEEGLRSVAKSIQEMASFQTINGDCVDLVKQYKDDENLLLYIDPPYFNCTNDYKSAFGFDKHMDLCDACMNAKAKIMISMHDAGLAPYLLKLFVEDNWYAYILPPIQHASRKVVTTTETVSEMLENNIIDKYEPHVKELLKKLKKIKESDELTDEQQKEIELLKANLKENEPLRKKKLTASVSEIVRKGLFDDKLIDEVIFCNFEISDYKKRGMKNLEYSVEDDLEMIFSKMIYVMYKEKSPDKSTIREKSSIDVDICKDIVKDINKYYAYEIFKKGLTDAVLDRSAKKVKKVVYAFEKRIRNIDSVKRITKKAEKEKKTK